jgi:cytochrome c oxidase assembly protein subunit 15
VAVSTAHACTAELFFALTVLLAFATSRAWIEARPGAFRFATPGQTMALVFFCLTFLQILMGAVLRHSFAGLAIPTFPLAFGALVPPFWNFGISVHFLHSRVGATLLVVLGLSLILRVLTSGHAKPVKTVAGILGGALLLQCVLGMLTIWSGKAPVPTTFHLSGGALVFTSGLLLFLMIYRLGDRAAGSLAAKGTMADITPASRVLPGASLPGKGVAVT